MFLKEDLRVISDESIFAYSYSFVYSYLKKNSTFKEMF